MKITGSYLLAGSLIQYSFNEYTEILYYQGLERVRISPPPLFNLLFLIIQIGRTTDSIKVASFIFDQETPRRDKVIDHLTTINEIEKRSSLDFLRELPDDIEERIEGDKNQVWVNENFE